MGAVDEVIFGTLHTKRVFVQKRQTICVVAKCAFPVKMLTMLVMSSK
ncbi:hypothetical protein COO91_10378 (plasmid) [Nostoc flagelliforme CCNUN1]|uniref:Uncharacterized protein n=1 Tax=Nostoc flagelliforme CCNUN1 TaxID=2038116 RepID=A0A2K8T8Y6_9NOSO|nr:hypothetical protein COO91_10378 [Nostoc flagelliforme CCNUN1]